METVIIFIVAISSLIGLIGFFISKGIFLTAGVISFICFILYGIAFIKDRERVKKLRISEDAGSKEEVDALIKQNKSVRRFSTFITIIIFVIIFFFFKISGICWIGIVFGLLCIPEIIKLICKNSMGLS